MPDRPKDSKRERIYLHFRNGLSTRAYAQICPFAWNSLLSFAILQRSTTPLCTKRDNNNNNFLCVHALCGTQSPRSPEHVRVPCVRTKTRNRQRHTNASADTNSGADTKRRTKYTPFTQRIVTANTRRNQCQSFVGIPSIQSVASPISVRLFAASGEHVAYDFPTTLVSKGPPEQQIPTVHRHRFGGR